MARINVEDLEQDPRFKLLVRRLGGDDEKALGKLVSFWKVAQHHWGNEKALVPETVFKYGDWDLLIDVDLAERRPDGIYARGSEKRFEWYLELCRHNRGLNDKRKARTDPGRSPERDPLRDPDGARTDPERGPSDSVSDSDSVSQSNPIGKPPTSGRGHPPPSAFDLDLARRWADHATEILPRLKPKLEEWANVVRLLREKDGLSEADLDATLAFVRSDHFWQRNAVSLPCIRQKSKNGLRKIDNILVAMKRPQKAKPQPPKATTEADFDW